MRTEKVFLITHVIDNMAKEISPGKYKTLPPTRICGGWVFATRAAALEAIANTTKRPLVKPKIVPITITHEDN